MKLRQWMSEARQLLDEAPLRHLAGSERGIPPYLANALGTGELDAVLNDWESLAGRLEAPLRIAFMGEVKAGKSTLLNALAAAPVSPTNVLEATAAIIEVRHGPEPRAAIRYVSGETQEGTPEEIRSLLEQKRGDQDFFATVDHVTITLPLPRLRALHLVDTPGLATLTEANARRTRDFLYQADVVVWVLDAHHPGQADVTEEIWRVAEAGRPIVGALNRIDELRGDISRLVAYVKREHGDSLKEVFPISAALALEGALKGDEVAWEQSGVPALLRYLEENIERRAEDVQVESIQQAARGLLRREKYLHERAVRATHLVVHQVARIQETAQKQRERIEKDLEQLLRQRVMHEFLAEELRGILGRIQEQSFFSLKSVDLDLKSEFDNALSKDRFAAWWQRVIQEVEAEEKRQWEMVLKELDVEIRHEWETLLAEEWRMAAALAEQFPKTWGQAVNEAVRWGAAGVAAGTALAVYSAVLGPAAATVTLGTALGTLVPPLAFASLAVGLVTGWFNARRQREQARLAAHEFVQDVRENLWSEFVVAKVLPYVRERGERWVAAVAEQHVKALAPGYTPERLQALMAQLQDHVSRADMLVGVVDA